MSIPHIAFQVEIVEGMFPLVLPPTTKNFETVFRLYSIESSQMELQSLAHGTEIKLQNIEMDVYRIRNVEKEVCRMNDKVTNITQHLEDSHAVR
jgi:hypothetical protein